jgi:hypothetical protein
MGNGMQHCNMVLCNMRFAAMTWKTCIHTFHILPAVPAHLHHPTPCLLGFGLGKSIVVPLKIEWHNMQTDQASCVWDAGRAELLRRAAAPHTSCCRDIATCRFCQVCVPFKGRMGVAHWQYMKGMSSSGCCQSSRPCHASAGTQGPLAPRPLTHTSCGLCTCRSVSRLWLAPN